MSTPKYRDLFSSRLFDNKLSDEDRAKNRPQWGNNNLAKSMDGSADYVAKKEGISKPPIPVSVNLVYPDGRTEEFKTEAIETACWSNDDGSLSIKLREKQDEAGDDFAL